MRRSFVAAFVALVLLLPSTTSTAIAQSASSDSSTTTTTSSGAPIGMAANIAPADSDLAAKCRTSELTQEKLLAMLHTIVMHGDLTDVAFIEATLQTKLQLQEPGGPIGDPNPDAKIYTTSSILGSPILVRLSVSFNSNDYPSGKEPDHKREGLLTFQGLNRIGVDFHDCKYLTTEAFNQTFGGKFSESHNSNERVVRWIGDGRACKESASTGKYAPTNIVYFFKSADRAITEVNISQGLSDGRPSPCSKATQ